MFNDDNDNVNLFGEGDSKEASSTQSNTQGSTADQSTGNNGGATSGYTDNSWNTYATQNNGSYSYSGGNNQGNTYTNQENGYTNQGNGYNTGSSNQGYTYYNPGNYSGGNQGSSYSTQKPKKQKVKKPKKAHGSGRKWVVAVSMALVVGLVAGTAFYGVNFVANRTIENVTNLNKTTPITQNNQDMGSTKEDTGTSNATASSGKTVTDVVNQCLSSLVTIGTVSIQESQNFFFGNTQQEVQGAGSGVIVGKNDTELLIATNNHVVDGATSLSVGFVDETTAEAKIKGTDPENDLAVISVSLKDLSQDTLNKISQAQLGDSDNLQLGEQVVAIGNALGNGQSITSGYVSALNRDLDLKDESGTAFKSTGLIQTDAAINSGNSGGALFNMKGELVGINEAKTFYSTSGTIAEGMGYAIPISKATPILDNLMSLPTRDKVDENEQGYLGVTCADVTAELAESYNMPQGVCVTKVLEGGAAEAAGIVKGDIITQIDGHKVTTYNQIKEQLQYYKAGDKINITVMRANTGEYSESVISVTLADQSVMEQLNQNGGRQK